MAVHGIKSIVKKGIRWPKRQLARWGYHSRPSFLIIGAQKSGTTVLFYMLRQHPRIVAPDFKELHFFDSDKYGDFAAYHSSFPLPYRLSPDRITFEATPSYLSRPDCPERIFNYAPDMRLVAVLREPVERAYSAWNMFRRFSSSLDPAHRQLAEHRSFEDAVTHEIKVMNQPEGQNDFRAYVRRGIYVEHLERYFRYFPRESCLILNHGTLARDAHACLADLCRFAGVDDRFRFTVERRNAFEYEDPIPARVADILRSYYAPYNESLYRLLGKDFDW